MRRAVVAFTLLALLAVVAFATRGVGWGGGRNRDPAPLPQWVLDSAYTLAILAGIALVIAYLLLRVVGMVTLRRRGTGVSPLGLIAVWAAIVAIGFGATEAFQRIDFNRAQNADAGGDVGLRRPDVLEKPGEARTRQVQFQWWLAALAAGLAATAAWVAYTRSRFPPPEDARVADELTVVLEETLDDLRGERDPRRAVIRAYARMEAVLGAHGLPRKPHEAPLEYLARILVDLRVRAASAFALTELFERAKFSRHEIDRAMKEEALAALAAVRDDLREAA